MKTLLNAPVCNSLRGTNLIINTDRRWLMCIYTYILKPPHDGLKMADCCQFMRP